MNPDVRKRSVATDLGTIPNADCLGGRGGWGWGEGVEDRAPGLKCTGNV